MRYRDVLPEARRNPHLNKKKSALEELRKYEGREDIFVSFTHDVGMLSHTRPGDGVTSDSEDGGVQTKGKFHNARGHKIGIYPQSGYDTPLGVYAYPLSYVLEKNGLVEYGNRRPYMVILRAREMDKVLDLARYTAEQYAKDKDKIVAEINATTAKWDSVEDRRKAVIAHIESQAYSQTPAGKLWNLTRAATNPSVLSDYFDELETDDEEEEDDFEDDWDGDEEIDLYAQDDTDDKNDEDPDQMAFKFESVGHNRTKPPVQWAKLFRRLGYDGAYDSGGEGIIHKLEPTQAVFFSKAAFDEIELIFNIDPETEPRSQVAVWNEKPELFMAEVLKGHFTPERFMNLLQAGGEAEALALKINWRNLPPSFIAAVIKNLRMMKPSVAGIMIRVAMDGNLPEDAVIAILNYEPDSIRLLSMRRENMTPAVVKWTMDNIHRFDASELTKRSDFFPMELYFAVAKTEIDAALTPLVGANIFVDLVTRMGRLFRHEDGYAAAIYKLFQNLPDRTQGSILFKFHQQGMESTPIVKGLMNRAKDQAMDLYRRLAK